MRIALVAPPFIPVPPVRYGGTELFIAHLSRALTARGHEVVLYANAESTPAHGVELRSLYEKGEWPLERPGDAIVKELAHTAWACEDASRSADVIHVNGVSGVVMSRFLQVPVVATLHHARDEAVSEVFAQYPHVSYVAISHAQLRRESLECASVVHHGLEVSAYPFVEEKDDYLAFLGRITPEKAPHVAIEVARRANRRLLIAGEIQPVYRPYWESAVRPLVDGRMVQYVGEAGFAEKVRLLGRASAMLFPIEWEEPFGLVMLEAMACGTPVLAFGRGSVPEVVANGVSGWICQDVADMARRAGAPAIAPRACRQHITARFTLDQMAAGYERVYERALESPPTRYHANASAPVAQN
jgi:glycosyltransferase involved in cell wall biosynthesis